MIHNCNKSKQVIVPYRPLRSAKSCEANAYCKAEPVGIYQNIKHEKFELTLQHYSHALIDGDFSNFKLPTYCMPKAKQEVNGKQRH